MDDFVERHGPGIAFLHRLAATEDYLEAKAHALLGIGAESSAKLYSILQQRLGPHVGSMPVRDLLTLAFAILLSFQSLKAPINRHGGSLQPRKVLRNEVLSAHGTPLTVSIVSIINSLVVFRQVLEYRNRTVLLHVSFTSAMGESHRPYPD